MSDNSELDIINHLLEIEKNASELIQKAKDQADEKIVEAKTKYNQEYKNRYDVMAAQKDAEYQDKLKQLEENHKVVVEDYKKSLETKAQNKEEFNKLLDSLLFKA